ncbi:MAG: DUF58 domain-containing protein [Chloroflexi bacterium]|nr:DUF58 domain-containing protein [Chloroflexota bacterium]
MPEQTLVEAGFLERLERLSLVSRRRVAGRGKGDRRSIRKGTSIEFVDYRHYTPGDDPRSVDWNIYRRSGNLYVKQFEEEEILTAHVLVDVSRSMDWGTPTKLHYASRLATALGYIVLAGSTRLAVATLSGPQATTFGPAWGRRSLAGLVQFLEREHDHGETDLDAALDMYARRAEPGLAILISDLLTPKFEQGIRRLLDRRFEVTVLHLLAPEEVQPAMGGDLTLVDRETGNEVAITLNQEALDRYADRFRTWTRAIESFCARHDVAYQRIQTSERLEVVLFDSLRRRGVLR